jgi:hypothetical protein
MDQPHNGTDGQPDSRPYDEPARWMTFAELAAARGISKDSAITLVRRHGWRRQRDNQGHVIALVPLTWAQESEGRADNPPASQPDSQPDAPTDRTVLAGALAALEDALGEANKRADTALALADRLGAQLADASGRIEQAEHRADAAQQRADRAEAARQSAEALIANLEADMRAKDSQLAQAESDSAEQRIAAEQARAQAHAAQDRTEEMTRAEEARKARGRLRRAWDGWRGR